MALSDERDFGMGSGQNKAFVIGKRERQIGAYVFLCTWCGGAAWRNWEWRASFQYEWKRQEKMASVVSSLTCHTAQNTLLLVLGSFWDCWCLLVWVVCV